MDILAWNKYFETGVEEVDRQHRYLVDRVNAFAPLLAKAGNRIPDGVGELFDQLRDYADWHFATEERLMSYWDVDARHIAAHHASHRRFVAEVGEMTAAYMNGTGVGGRELLGFITHWVIFHILGEDQALARQLRNIGAGMAPEAAFAADGESAFDPSRQALSQALIDMYAHFSEIAEHRETRVGELELQYRIVAEHTCDWETWIGADGALRYCSPACLRITGYAAQAFEDDPELLLSLVHPDDKAMLAAHLADDFTRPGLHEIIFRIRHADGNWRWLEHICQPVFDSGGQFQGRRASNRDVTERIGMASRLAEALAAAEKATQAKSAFLSNMSHEIRTPLNAVIGSALLMLQDIHEPKQRKRLQRIATSSQQLLALINDILDLAKIEAGRIALEKIDFELSKVLDTVESQIEEKLYAKGLSWRIERDPKMPAWLNGDPLRLGQILVNFASNAVKFTERGAIDLNVRMLGRNESGLRLRFEMRDTGCGFDPAKADAIFLPFEQEDGSTTRKHGGTGLGLAICRQLAQLMGGQVGAFSQLGQGSTFWLEVGLPEACAVEPDRNNARLKGKRAILIGDDPGELDRIGQLLKHCGMFVQQADTTFQLAKRIEVASGSGRPYGFMICINRDDIAPQFLDSEFQAQLASMRASQHRLYRLLAGRIDRLDPDKLRICEGSFDAVLPLPAEGSYLVDLCRKLLAGAEGEAARDHDDCETTAGCALDNLSAYAQRKLLLVEDNPINQEVMLDILGSAGLHPDVADNGQEALTMAAARRYDLILMDMQMPVMGGVEATRAIRRMPAYGAIPILAMTASAFEMDRQACLTAGMNDHIAKPVAPDVIYAALRRWLPAPEGDDLRHSAALPAAQIDETEVTLPEIPGLDVVAGLSYMGGKRARYRELLERLADDHMHDPVVLQENIRSGNFVEARRIAHSLKGASAMLGAETIRQLSDEIETRVHANESPQAAGELADKIEALGKAIEALQRGLV